MGYLDKPSLNDQLDSDGEFIGSESNNPFARIACRSRTMTPTLCDGTCGNCKKEREQFFTSESERLLRYEKANPQHGSDLDELEEPTLDDVKKRLQRRLDRIHVEKENIIQKRRVLYIKTSKRMEVLEKLALSPEAHPGNTLH